MGFIKNIKHKFGKKPCYTFRSRKHEVYITICSEIGAARLITPHTNQIVDATEDGDYQSALSPAFAEAYRLAVDAGDQKIADEIHAVRQIICF